MIKDTLIDECVRYIANDVWKKDVLTYKEQDEYKEYLKLIIKESTKEKDKEIERLNKQLDFSSKLNSIILKRKDKYKEIVDKMEDELRNDFDLLYCNPKSLKTFRSNEKLIKHELLNRLNYYKKVK